MAFSLFRGYLPTSNKIPKTTFKSMKSYEEVKDLSEYAGVLSEDTILIDVDDGAQSEILMDIVEAYQLKCKVFQTTRGRHFYFKNTTVDTCKTHTKLACGLTADIKIGRKKNSYGVLKFDNKERFVEWDKLDGEEYDELPKWLLPISSNIDFYNMGAGDGRNQAFFNYILTLQSNGFNKEEATECIEIINKYVVSDSLSESELHVILREDAFKKPNFFEKNQFLFDKFARFLISEHHICKINGQLHIYEDGIYVAGINKIESVMIKHIPNLNRTKRQEVLSYLDILLNKNMRPSSANFIAFKNGVYNVENDELIDYDPSIIITNKINHNYNPVAYSEVVDKTLNKLACNDDNLRLLMEEVVGYTFYKRSELRKAFILIGEKSNGKSTFLDMIREVLGEDNTSSLDLKDFNHEFKVANLAGSLANIGDDISDEFIVDTAMFKKIVSGDRVNTNKKFEKPFDFNPYCKLLFSANSIPRMGKSRGNEAIIDRLIIIPFNARFSPDDPDFDPYIKYKLRSEESLEYLIMLGIAGLKRVLAARRFTISESVQRELEEYEETNDPVIGYLKEITLDDVLNESTAEVYKRYNEYCLRENYTPLSNREFGKKINKYFNLETKVSKIQGKSIRIYVQK